MADSKTMTYQKAGVDIAAGDALIDWLQSSAKKSSKRSSRKLSNQSGFEVGHKAISNAADSVVSGIGGFAALFRASFQHMKSPLLVSSTDGVGTKVKLAAELKRYEHVGQDLVAMCVNDLACVGADPLFFLDYYACGKLDLESAKTFLTGVRRACDEVGCVLIGGETAEMPGVYKKGDFDCAGFAVGVVDESKVLGALRVRAGDRLIGVASSGFHSNGYSLLRKVFARDKKKWADVLLRPTHLYSPLVDQLKNRAGLHAVAHVTGGGFDNLLRVIPDETALELKPWAVPSEFLEVKRRAKLKWPQLLRTLNCGVGLVLFVAADEFRTITEATNKMGWTTFDLGEVVPGRKKVWRVAERRLES